MVVLPKLAELMEKTVVKKHRRFLSSEKNNQKTILNSDRSFGREAVSLLSPINSKNHSVLTYKKKKKKLRNLSQDSPELLLGSVKNEITEETLKKSLEKLEKVWEKKHIPKPVQNEIKSCFLKLPRHKAINVILNEVIALNENKSLTQNVIKSIKTREESLSSIYDLNSYLESTEWLSLIDVHIQCAELLHGHRLFTLNVVENIAKWKEYLKSSLLLNNSFSKPIEFKWDEKNYLVKMKSDLDFLKNSQFAKILNFSEKNDPLLIYPSIPLGRSEKGRKRDPNYFIDDGQAIVPIPSFMVARVNQADEDIKKEYEFLKFLEENSPQKQAEMFGPVFLNDIIDIMVFEVSKEFSLELKKQRKIERANHRQQKMLNKIADDLIEGALAEILNSNIENIAENAYRESLEDHKKQINNTIAEKITDDIINNFISSDDLQELCDSQYKDYLANYEAEEALRKQKLEEFLNNFSKEIFSHLYETVISTDLVSYAKETRRAFLKEEEEKNEIYTVRSPLMEEIGLDFATSDYFKDLSEMKWVPLNIPEELIVDVLSEYYSLSPDISLTILPDIEELMGEITKNMDTRWYWAVKGTLILALLVFSLDCYNKSGRKVIVHHVSSLVWKSFPEILRSATEHVWKVDSCDEIRINVYTKDSADLTPEIKRVFTSLEYKWKSKISLPGSYYEIIVLGKSRTAKEKNKKKEKFFSFSLKNSVVLTTSNKSTSNNKTHELMSILGNRQNLLHCLLGLYGTIEHNELKIASNASNKLQGVLNGLIEQMNLTQSFSFPFMASSTSQENLANFLSSYSIDVPTIIGKSSASAFELNFRWISCTNIIQKIRGVDYRYLRFKSKELKVVKVNSNLEIYFLPTELSNIQAFFICMKDIYSQASEEVSGVLDMFCMTERLLQKEGLEESQELWVPCFSVCHNWKIPWVEGYEITPQKDSDEVLFVDKCFEQVNVKFNLQGIPEGLLKIENKYGIVIMDDFIFGLNYVNGDKMLDLPLFSCLVKKNNWIQA